MIAALILAAGRSERMGYPKALLKIGTRNFVQHLRTAALEAGIAQCAVVLGHQAAEIGASLELGTTRILVNTRYDEGQLSSLQCGMKGLPLDGAEALLVLPVDHPMVSSALLQQLLSRFEAGNPVAVIPTLRGRRGHPALLSQRLFRELLDCPPECGARAVLRRHTLEIAFLESEDEAVLLNIDTPEDYRRLLQSRRAGRPEPIAAADTGHAHESLATAARHCPRCGGGLEMRPADSEGKLQRVCRDCGFIFYLNPKVVACTLPVLDGKLLLIRRNIDPARGLWTFPGGYVDLGESTPEAARRETREEVGLEVSLTRLLGVYSYPGVAHVVIVYVAQPLQSVVQLGVEAQEARYFEPHEIPWQELAFRSTADALHDFLGELIG